MHNFTLALVAIMLAPPLAALVAMAIRAIDKRIRRSTLKLTAADLKRAKLNALIG